MSTKPKSRWANDEEDSALEAERKREKEEKKRLKAIKQRKLDDDALKLQQAQAAASAQPQPSQEDASISPRPSKRRKLSFSSPSQPATASAPPAKLLRFPAAEWKSCRSVEEYEKLNDIEEGAYGWVSRAKDTATGKIVALKRLKMEGSTTEGVPVTGLREIQTLMGCEHENIVRLREVVVGEERSRIENIFLVLDFLEHDLRTLLTSMSEPFLPSETKTLLHQLISGVSYLHSHWILHRDLKTSNLLLSNRGILKIADFGMARYYGNPSPKMTQLVVTLWYRAPELLLGAERYSTEVDMWSVGCIFGEILTRSPLAEGRNEVDQLSKIFTLCGIPTERTWPNFRRLPNARSLRLPSNPSDPKAQGSILRSKFPFLTTAGSELLTSLLSLNPAKRPSAETMLGHPYFGEDPKPKSSSMFPTFPSKAGLERRRRDTPDAPVRGEAPGLGITDFSGIFAGREGEERGGGFSLKLI